MLLKYNFLHYLDDSNTSEMIRNVDFCDLSSHATYEYSVVLNQYTAVA